MLILMLPSFFSLFSFCHSLILHMDIFFCQRFLSKYFTNDSEIGIKLDSDELYCVTKTATYCLSVPL